MAPISTTLISRSPEVTTPSLTVNLVFRVFLAVLANLSCWVPLKHLHRHGEFAASVLVYSVVILNALTFINALTWRNDDIQKWWRGNVWCDIHPYIYQPALSVYTTSIVAIMHNLAQQVCLLRASPLTVLEKRRRMWNQALIIFSLPVIQMAWIYPLTKQRFMIGTLKGCTWISYPSWPFLVFFLLPTPILALVSGFYSVVTFKRYMQIERTTRAALLSSSSAATRANRTRRRLFLMTLCILVPFIPTVLALCFIQIRATIPLQAFDFRQIHPDDNLWPWHSITFYTHDELTFFDLNYNYLVILTGIPIFFFFGLKKDTKEIYHRFLVSIYLDRIFPGLRVEPSLDGPRPGLEASDGLQIVYVLLPPDWTQIC
ncbi:pheromone receptor 1 [Colletotrichum plurivorum]|uniref:Pheromone receptor 1 n=1 Tax=Colletotrichum plurivorum TaxID=2175906 RepID=A0A8H6NFB8_9PEZI|nr:pheromone receptor 1 [Colletotrichum plurivorum]